MPQLEFGDFAPQLIWLAITFILLYIAMSRVALPRIGRVLEERRTKIADDLDSADRLKREAEEALTAYEAALAQARNDAHAIAAQTRDKLAAESAKERAQLEEKLEAQLAEAEARITAVRDEAMDNVRTVAADVTAELVTKLTGQQADQAAIEAAVADALSARN